MKKFIFLFVLLFVSNCSYTPYINQIDTSNPKVISLNSLKKAKACTIFACFGDRTISKAMKDGNIKKVFLVEEEINFFNRCTVVYGE